MTSTHAIKSLVFKDKNGKGEPVTWGFVCYDSIENKEIEKEFLAKLKEYKLKAQEK